MRKSSSQRGFELINILFFGISAQFVFRQINLFYVRSSRSDETSPFHLDRVFLLRGYSHQQQLWKSLERTRTSHLSTVGLIVLAKAYIYFLRIACGRTYSALQPNKGKKTAKLYRRIPLARPVY